MTIRLATHDDAPAIGRLAEEAGLFPADMIEEVMEPALSGAEDRWLVADTDGVLAGFAFARPEEMADRVWNVLAIGVAETARNMGHANRLLSAVEAIVDARMMVIETTQLEAQSAARAFYEVSGYEQEGVVRDFYSEGEDKVVYRKVMA